MLKQCGIEKEYYQLILSILSKLGSDYSVFMSTFHAIRLVVPKWKIPSLNYFFDSLKKDKDKLIHMSFLNSSKEKDHSLLVQVNKNVKSKEKKIVKKPKLEIEEDSLKPTDEESVKMGKKKGRTHKCYYCIKVFHS